MTEILIKFKADKSSIDKELNTVVKKIEKAFGTKIGGVAKNFTGGFASGLGELGIGGAKGAAPAGIAGGLGKLLGAAGPIAIILNQALEFLGKIAGFLAESSTALKGTFMIFQKAMMVFFKPFGDFLASMLKPLAFWLLRMAIGFLKWTRGIGETFGKLLAGDLEGFLSDIVEGALDISDWLGKNFIDFFEKVFDVAKWLVTNFVNFFGSALFNVAEWLTNNFINFFEETKLFDIAKWLVDNFVNFIDETLFNVAEWLTNNFVNFFEETKVFDVAKWLTDNFITFMDGAMDIAEWLTNNFINFFTEVFNIADWLGKNFIDFFEEGKFNIVQWLVDNFIGFMTGGVGMGAHRGGGRGELAGMATGGIVTKPTLAMIGERGPEAVIPLGKARDFGSTTININNPIVRDSSDIDEIARKVSEKLSESNRRRYSYGKSF